MLKIRKTGESYYLASLTDLKRELDRNDSYLIKKELIPIIKSHREISVDLKGVRTVTEGAFGIFRDLVTQAETKRCKIKFINDDPLVNSKFISMVREITRLQKESEIN